MSSIESDVKSAVLESGHTAGVSNETFDDDATSSVKQSGAHVVPQLQTNSWISVSFRAMLSRSLDRLLEKRALATRSTAERALTDQMQKRERSRGFASSWMNRGFVTGIIRVPRIDLSGTLHYLLEQMRLDRSIQEEAQDDRRAETHREAAERGNEAG